MRNIILILAAFSLFANFAFALDAINCTTDEECQELNAGNVCMGGICGFAQEPADGSEDMPNPLFCETDEDCMDAGTGNTCMDGTCGFAQLPSGCETNEECMERNEGNECINGECAYAEPQISICIPGVFLALFAGFALFRK